MVVDVQNSLELIELCSKEEPEEEEFEPEEKFEPWEEKQEELELEKQPKKELRMYEGDPKDEGFDVDMSDSNSDSSEEEDDSSDPNYDLS